MIRETIRLIGGPSDGDTVIYSGEIEPSDEFEDFPVLVGCKWQSAIYRRDSPWENDPDLKAHARELCARTNLPLHVNYRFTGRYIETDAEQVSHP